MQKICLIQTSVSSMAEANGLAVGLIEAGLAACVQITAAGLSVYRWQGKLEQTQEYYLNIKTTLASQTRLTGWLKQHHPYELPEIIWHECDASDDYGNWLQAECA